MLFSFFLRPSGIQGFNEIGDFVLWLGGILEAITGWNLLPSGF